MCSVNCQSILAPPYCLSELLILKEWGYPITDSSTLFNNNKYALILATDSILHEHIKHIEVDVHFIREKVRFGIIVPNFVPFSRLTVNLYNIGPQCVSSHIF